MRKKFKPAAPIVLGMHDAIVSLTGLIAGLTVALADRIVIIISAIIASVTAGLSMGASCYLAEKNNDNPYAVYAGATTSAAYMATCVCLILPFCFFQNTRVALWTSFAIAVAVILLCNLCIRNAHKRSFWRHTMEMLVICTVVSVVAFAIGEVAKHYLQIAV